MKLYSNNENYKLYHGNMLDMLEVIEPNSIDSIITDPPYELNFMGKGWDNSGIAFQPNTWQKCYEVLKPGGYLLAFGGSRTFHRIACAIEDAGFEIRDTIMWLYGSGFPKSMSLSKGLEAREKLGNAGTRNKRKIEQACDTEEYNLKQTNNGAMGELIETTRKEYIPDTKLAKQWQGWGTCLKPSFEPIIVARKPFKGSLVDNVIEYGVGGINIDECRVESSKEDIDKLNKEWDREWNTSYKSYAENVGGSAGFDYSNARTDNKGLSGRFPANTILTYNEDDFDISSWLRYFYCAKASKKDRDEGLDEFEEKRKAGYGYDLGYQNPGEGMFKDRTTLKKNTHPTVKPTELMQYLIRLVTPNGGTILDPFNGSGSTGKAVMYENRERNKNYKYIGIELTEEYLPISKARIEYVCNLKKEKLKEMQMSLFDLESKGE